MRRDLSGATIAVADGLEMVRKTYLSTVMENSQRLTATYNQTRRGQNPKQMNKRGDIQKKARIAETLV